jgi:predicted DNA-binding protein with PD1-like motif
MQVIEDDGIIIIRLHGGEDVFPTLHEALRQVDLSSGVIVTGVGMLKDFELGWFDHSTMSYNKRTFGTPHELLSLNGTVAVTEAEEPTVMPHVHASLGGPDNAVVGGHLWKATTTVLNEIAVLRVDRPLLRRLNETTGLMELDLREL